MQSKQNKNQVVISDLVDFVKSYPVRIVRSYEYKVVAQCMYK